MTAEEKLLLIYAGASGPLGAAVPSGVGDPLDWQMLLELARRHYLFPLLYHRLRHTPVPPAAMNRLRRAYAESSLRTQAQLEELGAILRRLGEVGVEVMVLKGAALAVLVYRNPALRPFIDLDLLVRPRDLLRAQEVLFALGFRAAFTCLPLSSRLPEWAVRDGATASVPYLEYHRVSPQPPRESRPPTGTPHHEYLELHLSLVPPNVSVNPNLDEIWSRARVLRVGGEQTLTMAPEDFLIHLCIHAAFHNQFYGLRALVDLAEVLRCWKEEIDWDAIVERARRWGAAHLLYETLYLFQGFLSPGPTQPSHTPDKPPSTPELPPELLAEIRPSCSRLHLALISEIERAFLTRPDRIERNYDHRLTLIARSRRPGRYLARTLFPAPRAMALRYGLEPTSPRVALHYLIRPLALIRQAAPSIARQALRLLAGKVR